MNKREPARHDRTCVPVDVARYPLDRPVADWAQLVDTGRDALGRHGSFSLDHFIKPEALRRAVVEIEPMMRTAAYHHRQRHNIYFAPSVAGLTLDHPALSPLSSSNHTLTADQLLGTIVHQVYQWEPLRRFLMALFGVKALYRMADPLARLNVMGYHQGDEIGWHFDRARYTVTLLLQSADSGGAFQYRRDLRTETAPNHDAVARLLNGADDRVETLALEPGMLNIFAGRFAAHRVTPIAGDRPRLMAVLSFVDRADVSFSPADRVQFYGRARPLAASGAAC